MTIDTVDADSLLSANAVRDRAQRMLAIGLNDQLPHFRIDLSRLDTAVDLVIATTRKNYPAGDVPFHSRWRHFVVGGTDRWTTIADATAWSDRTARARAEFDLAIVSVLLDAGAGPAWRYRDATSGASIGRSEGLALASLDMFVAGAFSTQAGEPLRAGRASFISAFPPPTWAAAFRSPRPTRWSASRAGSICSAIWCAARGQSRRLRTSRYTAPGRGWSIACWRSPTGAPLRHRPFCPRCCAS